MKHILLILLSIISISGSSQELTLGIDSLIQYTQKIGYNLVVKDTIVIKESTRIRIYTAEDPITKVTMTISDYDDGYQSYDNTYKIIGEYYHIDNHYNVYKGKEPMKHKYWRVVIYDYTDATIPISHKDLGFATKGGYGGIYKNKYVILTSKGRNHYKEICKELDK